MRELRILMGMPITVEVVDATATPSLLASVYDYFTYVDEKFSTYSERSEISCINRGELRPEDASEDMRIIFALAEKTRLETEGYFDIRRGGKYDPSGVVKGWAILKAAELLRGKGARDFYIDAGGDVQVSGHNAGGQDWRVGIRNPFRAEDVVKVLSVTDLGVATSGTYARGQHIYDPHKPEELITDIVSLTVIGPDICEADRFATAAFAMGRPGIYFIEQLSGLEGYMIDREGVATSTTGLERYLLHDPAN